MLGCAIASLLESRCSACCALGKLPFGRYICNIASSEAGRPLHFRTVTVSAAILPGDSPPNNWVLHSSCGSTFAARITQRHTGSRSAAVVCRSRRSAECCRSFCRSDERTQMQRTLCWQQTLQKGASQVLTAGLAAAVTLVPPSSAPPAVAADAVATGKCLISNCPKELAQCLADPSCVQNLICIQGCQGRDDEQECQVRCSNRYENATVKSFNTCAITEHNCVPQRNDSPESWPVPPDSALDGSFELSKFAGRWFITAGLNPLFDTFPCQEHFFAVPEKGHLVGRINWRIPKGAGGDFLERTAIQTFDQQENPAILFNGNNPDTLYYTDTWYILDSDTNGDDAFVLIYYKGANDAWTGYGGATLYTKSRVLPKTLVPRLQAALEKVNRKWEDFRVTNNSCSQRPPARNAADAIDRDLEMGKEDVETAEGLLGKSFQLLGRGLGIKGSRDGFNTKAPSLAYDKRAEQQEQSRADKVLKEIERQYQDRAYN